MLLVRAVLAAIIMYVCTRSEACNTHEHNHAAITHTHTHTHTHTQTRTRKHTHTHTHTHSMHVLDIHSAALLLDLHLNRNEASQPTCNHISAHEASQFPEHHSTHRPPRLRLLDVGAGDGAVTAELAPLFAGICEVVLKISKAWY